MKLKTGDLVKVLTGKDNGKTGNIELILKTTNKAIVKSINLVKRHYKPQRNSTKQGILEKSMPLNLSNLGLICPNCQQVTRIKYKIIEGKKVRLCQKCSEVIQ